MSTSILEFKKAIQTLQESIDLYQKAVSGSAEKRAFRDASIQRFEYCIELSWKTSMKVLGSTTKAPKPAIREMARNDLISDAQKWLGFIESRNKTSHSYDEDIALEVYQAIELFLPEVKNLVIQLEKL